LPGLWAEGATAAARGDPLAAADLAARMGAVSHEAFARLAAARQLADPEQLEPALTFFRSVGATRFVREAESLFAASA
jgi:hypothetical protein